jgi:hypothetical protein
MTRYYLEITCQMQGMPLKDAETVFERLADAVYGLTSVIDADLGRSGDRFDFSMAIDAEDPPSALADGLSALRCAIHTAGGNTAGWENYFETIKQVIRPETALARA